ncbi:NgoMIV family type II restriction endonuclease [Amycolatopsis thermoflava]|uniref:NgoMIV family type II restriction endonuclease n=1 Tax=Amycolatopsis thermoflava TaxID=84480 RepID=UPI003648BB62
MTVPDWLQNLLGWRPATEKSTPVCKELFKEAIAPNIADVGTKESLRIAGAIYEQLGIPHGRQREDIPETPKANQGTPLERGIEEHIRRALDGKDSKRRWRVTRRGSASDYAQFSHLAELQKLLKKNENQALRAALGRDYHIKTDILVGVAHPSPDKKPFLHAAISCKWSIRSDRVQNVRHEFGTLVRHRRGRLPHLVLVTAEPLPDRLISIARGTGEVDAVYHLLYDQLDTAVKGCGTTDKQKEDWSELVEQERVKPFRELVDDLVLS